MTEQFNESPVDPSVLDKIAEVIRKWIKMNSEEDAMDNSGDNEPS